MADNLEATSETGWRRLLGNALTVAVAGGFANVLNLGVTIGAAHLLKRTGGGAYGAYGQMVGVFFIVALSGSALGVAVVRRAGYYIVRGDHVLTTHWQRRLHQRVLAAAVVCAALALPSSVIVASWLGHRSWVAVWTISLASLTFAVLSVDRALLQSRQRYGALAQNFVVEGVVRTAFTLVGLTHGVTGYAVGLLIAEICTRLHAYRLVRLRVEVDHGVELEHTGLTQELAIALVTLAFMAILQYIDIFVIGHANPKGAGSYTAISIIAKVVVFGAVILSSFLLPEAVLASRKGAEAVRQLTLVLGLLGLAAVVFVGVTALYPHQLVSILGKNYVHASSSLETLVLAMVALSISTILVTFLLGDGARWPTLWIGVCVLGGVFWINGAHGQWHGTALRDLELQVVVLMGLIAATLNRLRRQVIVSAE